MEKNLRLQELFEIAKKNKLVKNQKEFSVLINIDNSNLTHALRNKSERVNIDNAVLRAEHALMKAGVNINSNIGDGSMQNVSGSNNSIGVPPKNFTHEKEWFALVAEKDKQINRLLSIIEKMQK